MAVLAIFNALCYPAVRLSQITYSKLEAYYDVITSTPLGLLHTAGPTVEHSKIQRAFHYSHLLLLLLLHGSNEPCFYKLKRDSFPITEVASSLNV